MSTVADDLLNDFGSSGDEAEELETDGLVLPEKAEKKVNGDRDAMDVDDDDDNEEASDDEGAAAGAGAGALNDMEDAEATKAKVEKMQLGAVKDVRSVASLMQTLEPVLEVSRCPTINPIHLFSPYSLSLWDGSFTSLFRDEQLALTCWLDSCRKSTTTDRSPRRSRRASATSRTTPSTTC